jgi:hypothetical protein
MEGLQGRHQGSKPRRVTPAVQARVFRRARQKPSDGSTHWSCRKSIRRSGRQQVDRAEDSGAGQTAAAPVGALPRPATIRKYVELIRQTLTYIMMHVLCRRPSRQVFARATIKLTSYGGPLAGPTVLALEVARTKCLAVNLGSLVKARKLSVPGVRNPVHQQFIVVRKGIHDLPRRISVEVIDDIQ